MSISDTSQARKYASIAEVAAAQAKLSADKLESAPDYAQQAKEYSEAAKLSSQTAQQAESATIGYALSASQSASDAASSATEAGAAAEAAVSRCVRVPDGESISILPASASRELKVITFDENADVSLIDKDKFAIVDDSGKIPVSMIPSIALTEPFVVSSEADMLALDAQVGDIAKRTDLGYSFCLASSPASVLGNWVQLTDDVLAQLGQQTGATQIGALNEADSPTTVQGALDEKATKSSLTSFATTLASTSGASSVGVLPKGNLSQLLNYVTPEQFGAIGDGTLHPLSERYATLAAAQAVYPFVTSLTQTIDWAACQAAENYARGKVSVRLKDFVVYHFGDSNYLELGINSSWIGRESARRDSGGPKMIRTKPSVKPAFGQDCVVRVMDASSSGSADEFVRGIVFKGIILSRNVPRRSATKNDQTICFHANFGIIMDLGIVAEGAEYGIFGYSYWGSKGWLYIDSCHKAFYADAATLTPEYPVASSGAVNTTFDFKVHIDACVFGLVLNRVKYSKFSGYIEGMLANSTYQNYDYANETAIAVTVVRCDSIDVTELGIEAWQGIHVYSNESTITVNESWTQDALLLNTTGKHGPYQAMATLTGNTELFTIPSTNNSYFYAVNKALLTLRNMTGDMSSASFANTFLITTDSTSRFCMENCGIYFGSSRLIHPLNGCWSNISFVNDRFFKDYMVPSGYTWIGNGMCQTTAWTLGSIGATGQVTLTAPSGWSLLDFEAYANIGSNTQASATAIIGVAGAPTSSGATLQTNFSGTAGTYSVYYKMTLLINK
ncbi:hypothetical protein SNN70_004039 [Cronobacter malonaticus]|nr:hypothetical protein [Cronobacter malonaticus]